MVIKSKQDLGEVESVASCGAGVALSTPPRQDFREKTASRVFEGCVPSEEARPSRPRRSPRHKRHAVTGEADRTRLRTSTESSSNSSPAHSQSTTSSNSSKNGTVSSSLLWALANSTTADSVAVAMIKDSSHEDEHKNDPPIQHKDVDRVPQFHILHSVSANKSQLKGTFHSIFYPKQLLTAFVPILFLLLNVQSTSEVQLAEHALHLAQLGTTSKDDRAIREALRVYHATVIQLRRRLSKPDAVLNDQVFAVVHLLRICETYKAISHDESGRRRHHEGIGQLLVAKGSKSHIKSFPLRISLEMYQQSQLWEMLATRQGSRTSTPEWAELNRDDKCKWKLPQLTGFILRLPRILQKVEEFLAQEEDVLEGDILDALSAIKGFENGLRQWMNRFYVEHPEVPYWRVKMEKCPWVKPVGDATDPPVFASAFDFAGTAIAKAHQLFWMALLASSEASKDLADLLLDPLPPHETFKEQDRRLLEETNDAADNLCMTAVYMSQPDNGVDSWIDACHSLQFAALWYDKSGASEKTSWCKTTISHIETRGIRAPILSRRHPPSRPTPSTQNTSTSTPPRPPTSNSPPPHSASQPPPPTPPQPH